MELTKQKDLDYLMYALSSRVRRQILFDLGNVEKKVSEIHEHYAISLVAISKHVAILHKARLVEKRQAGNLRLVRANPQVLETISAWMTKYLDSMHDQKLA